MQIKDILSERRIQRVQTMFHGTSSTLVPSILKHGLLANPPKTTYSRDSNVDTSGYDTFKGGIYLTSDVDKAEEGADMASAAHQGDPVLITLQYVLSSGGIDEDDIMSIMTEAILSDLPTKIETISDAAKYYSDNRNFQTALQRIERAYTDPSTINLSSYNARPAKIKLNRNALVELKVLATVVLRHIADQTARDRKVRNYISYSILNEIRHNPAFETAMYNVLASVKPIDSDTVRVTRNIGFKGKTRIIRIENRINGKVYYDQSRLNKPNAEPVQTEKADWYFFGNIEGNYAWGIGTTPEKAIADGKNAFEEWASNDEGHTWEDEMKECKVYPTDKRTIDLIDADGYRTFVRQGNLIVADQNEQ